MLQDENRLTTNPQARAHTWPACALSISTAARRETTRRGLSKMRYMLLRTIKVRGSKMPTCASPASLSKLTVEVTLPSGQDNTIPLTAEQRAVEAFCGNRNHDRNFR